MNRTLERHRNIIDFALSSLLRRKAKNISLLVLYALIVFALASVVFFTQALKRESSLLLKDAPDMVVQKMVAGRHDLIPTDYGLQIATIRGVKEVQPRLWGYYYDPAIGANYTLVVPAIQPPAPQSISIGSGVARVRRLGDGDLMPLLAYNHETLLFEVNGILPADTELVASDLILIGEGDFRTLFSFPRDVATDLAVTVTNPQELTTVARKIVARFPDTRPILKSEILRTYDAIFDWRGGMMMVLLAAAVLSFVIFAWDKATGLSAEERKEIGILKSIGWETSDVLLLKSWEGIVISLSAFLVGTLLAYGHVFFFSATLFEHALKGWGVLYPRFRLVPSFDLYQIALLFFLTVLPYTAATIIPSWRAATVDPDAAMRS
jgi:ABC-type lipoprotein release transport system permease subunit